MKPITENFLDYESHFAALVNQMPEPEQRLYNAGRHTRVETAYFGRNFVVYRMGREGPLLLDRLVIQDFHCDDQAGASAQIKSKTTGETVLLSYRPLKILAFDFFMFLPLDIRTRWSAPASNLNKGSLAFPIVLRTPSRLGLQERGVTYCETGKDYGKEFGKLADE